MPGLSCRSGLAGLLDLPLGFGRIGPWASSGGRPFAWRTTAPGLFLRRAIATAARAQVTPPTRSATAPSLPRQAVPGHPRLYPTGAAYRSLQLVL